MSENNDWLDGMENSGIFKTVKRKWNILTTGSCYRKDHCDLIATNVAINVAITSLSSS